MDWIQKDKTYSKSEFDSEVMITRQQYKKGCDRFFFKFMKNSIYKIMKNYQYITLAKQGRRIYFKEINSKFGFKVSDYGDSSKCFKVVEKLLSLSNEDLGEYNLEYDSELGLHYIDFNRKLKKELDWKGRFR